MDFRVEQEDSVYPMVPAGADLDAMIRRPEKSRAGGNGCRPDRTVSARLWPSYKNR